MTLIIISDQIFPDFNNGISEGFVRVREEWGRWEMYWKNQKLMSKKS